MERDERSFSCAKEQSSEDTDLFQQLETPDVVNRDNKMLHPWGPIGHVDEVNGMGATEIPQYVPTRSELIALVKYWAAIAIELEFRCFLFQQSDSLEIRLIPFADRRIARIEDCLGNAPVTQACKEAEDEFAKTVDAEAWQVFRHGTAEERAAFQAKVAEKMYGPESGTDDIEGEG